MHLTYEISVVIPVHNGEDYIEETLNSLVNQTLGIENIEVIIVNDKSTDNTLDIIGRFDHPSIKVINNRENIGAGESKNKAIEMVSSPYLTFLDADDFISENTLESGLELIKKSNAEMLIYNWSHYPKDEPSIHKPNIDEDQVIAEISEKPELIYSTPMWNRIFHENLYGDIEFSNLTYDDNVVAIKTLLNSKKTVLMKNGRYFYRKNPKSITSSVSLKSVLDLIESRRQLADYDEAKPLIERFVEDIIFWLSNHSWFEDEQDQIITTLKETIEGIDFENKDIERLKNTAVEVIIPYYNYRKLKPAAKLYVDTGKGFNENETVEIAYEPERRNVLNFDISNFENVERVRFDPVGSDFVKVHIFDSNCTVVGSNCDNDIDSHYNMFLTLDPWYVMELNDEVNNVRVEFQIQELDKNEMNELIMKSKR